MNEILGRSDPFAFRSVAAFAAGIALIQQLPDLPGRGPVLLAVVALPILVRFKLKLSLSFLLGLVWATGYGTWLRADRLPVQTQRLRAIVEGEILDIPRSGDRGVRFDFRVDRYESTGDSSLPRKLRLSWYDEKATPRAGERWRLLVSLRRPHGMLNPGGLDYEQWLFAQGIGALGYVRDSTENRPLAPAPEPLSSTDHWRQALFDRINEVLTGKPFAGVIAALTMGVDDGLTPEQWTVFRRTGTTHLIAISGSHIGLVAALAFFLAQAACARLAPLRWPPPYIAAAAGAAAALFYSALADFAVPTQRALIMIAVAMGAILLQRNTGIFQVLTLALFAVLAFDPLAILAPGFWLSFGAVALIGFTVSHRTGRSGPVRTFLRINWAAAVGLAPMLLWSFRQISLVSPLANLIAVPVLGMLLVPICLSAALLLPVFPAIGAALFKLAEWILEQFWPVLEWLSALPWAQWDHAEPPFWTIPLACIGTLLLLAPHGIPARWLGLVMLVPAFAAKPEKPEPNAFRLTLLDVGQGLAVVVETQRRVLVFDTGARLGSGFDMGSAVIEPFLRQRGWNRIDTLIVSHGDNDHIGGAATLLKDLPVNRILTSVPERLREFAPLPCRSGQSWHWDGVDFAVLGPVVSSESENDNSCILRVSGAGGSVLLTGDVEKAGEALLVKRYGARLASDVLVVPHHGSSTSSTAEFLQKVRPNLALIPAGFLNRFGFPKADVVERYRRTGVNMLNTADWGAIRVDFGARRDVLTVRRYRAEYARYWTDWPAAGRPATDGRIYGERQESAQGRDFAGG